MAMNEPSIQYATASDGARIAYWMIGSGPPLVILPMLPFSHIQLEWLHPERRAWYERLASRRAVIRYDSRGSGLSEREAIDFSLGSQILDLDAVVDKLGLDRFAMFAPFFAGPAAIRYAACNPERVSRLVLWCTFPKTADYLQVPQAQGIMGLVDTDWELFTETLAHVIVGWSKGEPARRFAAFMRECITQTTCKAAISAYRGHDATADLSQVACPTIAVHRRQLRGLERNFDQSIVSAIPDCRLMLLEGESGPPFVGDLDEVHASIGDFLSQGEDDVAWVAGPAVITPLLEPLSFREQQVLRLVGDGLSNQAIAEEIVVTVGTVKSHLRNIYRKLDVRSRTQALGRARELGLLQ
jgi:DNA-binding CsgD family transcriptional regulator